MCLKKDLAKLSRCKMCLKKGTLAKLSRCMAARAELAPKVRAREVGMSALVNTTALRLMFSS